MSLNQIRKEIAPFKNPTKAKFFHKFFKAGKGEYAEGDQFLGLTVPQSRSIAKKFKNEEFKTVHQLLKSKFHEERLIALLIFVDQYKKGDEKKKQKIFNLYKSQMKYINHWDLIDVTSHHVFGAHVFENQLQKQRVDFSKSKNLWKRRVSIVSTFYDLRKDYIEETMKTSKTLVHDEHDLIHKAVGWLLREVGKKDLMTLEEFLKKYQKTMPRTMLRYAIEKLPERKRKAYLAGTA